MFLSQKERKNKWKVELKKANEIAENTEKMLMLLDRRRNKREKSKKIQ
jgi:hypothetical protein